MNLFLRVVVFLADLADLLVLGFMLLVVLSIPIHWMRGGRFTP